MGHLHWQWWWKTHQGYSPLPMAVNRWEMAQEDEKSTLVLSRNYTQSAAGPRLWNSLPVQLRNPDITYGLSDDSWRGTFFGKHEHGTLWLLICGTLLTYLLTYLQSMTMKSDTQYTSSYSRSTVFIDGTGFISKTLTLKIPGSIVVLSGDYTALIIMANERQPMTSYSCLTVTTCIYFQATDNVNFPRSKPFRPVPVVVGPHWLMGLTAHTVYY